MEQPATPLNEDGSGRPEESKPVYSSFGLATEKDAAAVGRFEDEWGRTYPRLQIITLAELFQGKKPDIPFVDPSSQKHAKREDMTSQGTLL